MKTFKAGALVVAIGSGFASFGAAALATAWGSNFVACTIIMAAGLAAAFYAWYEWQGTVEAALETEIRADCEEWARRHVSQARAVHVAAQILPIEVQEIHDRILESLDVAHQAIARARELAPHFTAGMAGVDQHLVAVHADRENLRAEAAKIPEIIDVAQQIVDVARRSNEPPAAPQSVAPCQAPAGDGAFQQALTGLEAMLQARPAGGAP